MSLAAPPAASRRTPGGARRRLFPYLRHALLLAWSAFVLFPIFWMVSTSFKESWEWVAWPPHWLPYEPTLYSYRQIFAFSEMGRDLARSASDQVFAIWGAMADSPPTRSPRRLSCSPRTSRMSSAPGWAGRC